MSEFNIIDLFCGCGGLSLGFSDAGFNILYGFDNDDISLKTFKGCHKNALPIQLDLANFEIEELEKYYLQNKQIDMIIAGPPCQGFSLTGPRNFDDERNKLYLSVIALVNRLKPKAFLIENVPGLVTLYDGLVKDEIIRRFSKFYNVSYKILNSADYGVPQIRKRVFFVGVLKSIGKFEFPEPTYLPGNYVSCKDAIGDLPSRESELGLEEDIYDRPPQTDYQKKMRGEQRVLFNHVATNHTEKVKNVIALVPEGGNYRDLPSGVGGHRKFNEAWTRYHSKKPSRTIDTGHRNHFHYKWNRVPTVRENARLQSFPDRIRFYGTRTKQYRHVGNAVPPILAYHLALSIMKVLDEGK